MMSEAPPYWPPIREDGPYPFDNLTDYDRITIKILELEEKIKYLKIFQKQMYFKNIEIEDITNKVMEIL